MRHEKNPTRKKVQHERVQHTKKCNMKGVQKKLNLKTVELKKSATWVHHENVQDKMLQYERKIKHENNAT